jgi:hypothetical protein
MKPVLVACLITIALSSCGGNSSTPPIVNPPPSSDEFGGGALLDFDLGGLPVAVGDFGANPVALPKFIDLSANLPAVGNQKGYGTCVAWATGYYLKTYLDARDKNLETAALNSSNTFSPSFLFRSIPDDLKGTDCNGTNIDKALEAMKTGGIAPLSISPSFANTKGQPGECNLSTVTSSEKSAASSNKIDRYFRLNPITTDSIKTELAAGRPVAVGISVGKGFTGYTGGVISSDTGEGGHAMLLVGYDDTKGAGGAFKGVNSWGSKWGESGFYWIDYNYLVKSVKDRGGNAFVAYNPKAAEPVNPPIDNENKPNLTLYTPNIAYTYDANGLDLTWDMVNTGDKDIPNSAKYFVFFVYVNDNDASVFVLDNSLEFGRTDAPANKFNFDVGNNFAMNVALPSGSTLAEKIFKSADFNIISPLGVPNTASGDYRLWVIVSKNLDESDYDDNYLYTEDTLKVVNGQFQTSSLGATRSSNTLKLAPLRAKTSNYRYEDLVPLFDRIKAQGKLQLQTRAANKVLPSLSSVLKSSIPK